jgi:hypothetical protein
VLLPYLVLFTYLLTKARVSFVISESYSKGSSPSSPPILSISFSSSSENPKSPGPGGFYAGTY